VGPGPSSTTTWALTGVEMFDHLALHQSKLIYLWRQGCTWRSLVVPRRRGLPTKEDLTMITPGIDHLALTVPDLDEQVERLVGEFGMVVEGRTEHFALVTDPASGLKLELGRSGDTEVHFRHLGFRADDVDGAHEHLVSAGMTTSEAPHRRDFARMYTSFLTQPGGLEVQLVTYDD
jgi:hypothetical protein